MRHTKLFVPKQFIDCINGYKEYLRLKGLRDSSIDSHCYSLIPALQKFDADGIKNLRYINPATIYRIYERTSDKHSLASPLRSFLRYLFKAGEVSGEFSEFVPTPRRKQLVPSVYTKDEMSLFLDSFNRNSATGKRNFAIALLALRLGMRVSDIMMLKVSDIDYDKKKIFFIQSKTNVKQFLELVDEVGDALRDYLDNARPASSHENVFLTSMFAIKPLAYSTIYNNVREHLLKSGVKPNARKCGLHSLRMTFASELVAEKVPYDAVRKILGHETPTATKHYVGFDVESLRTCAIPVPPLSGIFERVMKGKVEGVPL